MAEVVREGWVRTGGLSHAGRAVRDQRCDGDVRDVPVGGQRMREQKGTSRVVRHRDNGGGSKCNALLNDLFQRSSPTRWKRIRSYPRTNLFAAGYGATG